MCQVVGRVSSGGAPAAVLFELCDSRSDLAHILVERPGGGSPPELMRNKVFAEVLRSFETSTHALLELNYFDLDFRSSLAATIAIRHEVGSFTTDRLIFMSLKAAPTEVLGLPGVLACLEDATVHGYLVITPDSTGPIGRSIIPPPLTIDGVKDTVDIGKHVRSGVYEDVTILGCRTRVFGVPFMQQDGNLILCAHAACWMTHYTAVLRCLSARRDLGAFAEAVGAGDLTGRQMPSVGLTSSQVATVLNRFGLPPEVFTFFDLATAGRSAEWYDRESIWTVAAELSRLSKSSELEYEEQVLALEDEVFSDPDTEWSDDGVEVANFLEVFDALWVREALTRNVCQYLNSGFPSILLGRGHARVVVGYLRRSDLVDPTTLGEEFPYNSSETDVEAFLVSDDQAGPYRLMSVSELVDIFMSEPSVATLVIPLPRGVWVKAAEAEEVGARVFAGLPSHLLQSLNLSPPEDAEEAGPAYHAHVDERGVAVVRDRVQELGRDVLTGEGPTGLAVRSYVVLASDFKAGFGRRCGDSVAIAQLRAASLPKFVWVIEVVRRGERAKHEPCVLGEVVLDATDIDLRETNAYIVHLPGAIKVRGASGAGRWHVTGVVDAYPSGRYHDAPDWSVEIETAATRWKGTLP
jgi:hypothetical protein